MTTDEEKKTTEAYVNAAIENFDKKRVNGILAKMKKAELIYTGKKKS